MESVITTNNNKADIFIEMNIEPLAATIEYIYHNILAVKSKEAKIYCKRDGRVFFVKISKGLPNSAYYRLEPNNLDALKDTITGWLKGYALDGKDPGFHIITHTEDSSFYVYPVDPENPPELK